MSDLGRMQPEKLNQMKLDACTAFGPMILREALHRIATCHGDSGLKSFEKMMIDRIESFEPAVADIDNVREFAIEQLYAAMKDVREMPDNKQPVENIERRRTSGRSEDSGTLEEQLQTGLEDSFPASDPPAVISTAISRRMPRYVNEGTVFGA